MLLDHLEIAVGEVGACAIPGHNPPVQGAWFALGFLEVLECGEMRVMTTEITLGKLTTR